MSCDACECIILLGKKTEKGVFDVEKEPEYRIKQKRKVTQKEREGERKVVKMRRKPETHLKKEVKGANTLHRGRTQVTVQNCLCVKCIINILC